MQHVILMSSRIDRLPTLLGGDPGEIPAAYVPTAADVTDDPGYVAEEIDQLTQLGFPVTPLPLAELSRAEVEQGLEAAALVFVSGGSVFHLLHHASRSGFADLVPPLVRAGKLTYAGVSAGAVLAGPDLFPVSLAATQRAAAGEPTTTTALGLVPFTVLPHYGDPDRAERSARVLAAKAPQPIVPLTNEQVADAWGTDWRILTATAGALSVDDVARLARDLPEVTEAESRGSLTWKVRGKSFAWERPFSKADLKRFGDVTPPDGPIAAVRVEDLHEKEAVLAAKRPGVFTIPHFDGYAAVLIQLNATDPETLRELVTDGWLAMAPAGLAP